MILGCTNQAGEDNRNVARMAALLAGLPVDIPGQTVNRLCGSGLQAVASAAQAIKAGEGDAFIAGGVESMTRAPYVMLKSASPWNREVPPMADTTVGWRFTNPRMKKEWTVSLGMTAENVAKQWGITREEQDAFAAESQRRAGSAMKSGVFDRGDRSGRDPTQEGRSGHRPQSTSIRVRTRRSTSSRRSSRPSRRMGRVTAGNSSGINDGASALLVVSSEGAAGAEAARPHHHDRGRRGRSVGHGHRSDPGHAQGARAGRHDDGPDRSD